MLDAYHLYLCQSIYIEGVLPYESQSLRVSGFLFLIPLSENEKSHFFLDFFEHFSSYGISTQLRIYRSSTTVCSTVHMNS